MRIYGYQSANSNRGFSLLELLISLLIFSFGMLGVFRLHLVNLSNNADSKTHAEAIHQAELKLSALTQYATEADYAALNSGNDAISPGTGSNATLYRQWTVTGYEAPDYKKIVVKVYWTDQAGKPQSVSLMSYVALDKPVLTGHMVKLTPLKPPP